MIVDRFARIGNNLSADFANTTYAPDDPEGSLRGAEDVVDFLVTAGALAADDAARMRRSLAKAPAARAFFTHSLELRSAVIEALRAIEAKRALREGALTILNGVLEADAGFARLERRRGARYHVVYHRIGDDMASALTPIARDTARLLSAPDVPVRRCAGPGCTRYFYDDSRTHRRRWCDMAICGNRAKAATFAARQREAF